MLCRTLGWMTGRHGIVAARLLVCPDDYSLLLGGHPESITRFASLYLARARQRHVWWGGEICRSSGQRKPLDPCVRFSPSPGHGLALCGSAV